MLMRRANRLDRSLVARRLQPGWIGHLTVTALLLTVRLPVAAQSRPKEDLPVSLAAEIKQLRDLVLDQVKAIEALRAQVAEQQAKIEALQGPAEGKNALPPALMTSLPTAPGSPARPNEKKEAPSATPPTLLQAGKAKPETPSSGRKWFEKYSLRGYTQFRYNRLLETNPQLSCEQCDRSWGNNNGVFVRRARLILSGDITDRVFMYIQPDLASTVGSSLHYAQLRDLYFDVALDKEKEFRIRVGQSKIPFGFENLQSSQNRLALDRVDALNSAAPNERDLGAFFYWAPAKIRKRFSHLVSSGLKGSGDYGVFGAGLYDGQTANRPEANNNLHVVTRLSYPFELKSGRFIEAGIAAYTGQYTLNRDQRNAGTAGPELYPDRRVEGSLTIYPQPLGFQAEYNVGRGPQFNPSTLRIEDRHLRGGYAQIMYMRKFHRQVLTPFIKFQYYNGGKKQETDARKYLVRDEEFGVEWQPNPFVEFTATYTHSDRTFEDFRTPSNRQTGNLLRLQLQFNY